MEKNNNLQQKTVNDDELEQVAGGRNLFEVVTAEFREFFDERDNKNASPSARKGNNIGVATLEMRANPMEQQETRKVVKL